MSLEKNIINPFCSKQISKGVISYGVSSYGYDVRIANKFMMIKKIKGITIDPKKIEKKSFDYITVKKYIIIPPNFVILGKTIEYLRIPRNVLVIAFGKSTYARCGLLVNITPFEPEWEGYVTISMSNISSRPIKLYVNEGIAQIIFFETKNTCDISYNDKNGKYQMQKNITTAKIYE